MTFSVDVGERRPGCERTGIQLLLLTQLLTNVKKEGSRDHQRTIQGIARVPKAVMSGTLPKLHDRLASIK